MNVIDLFAGAGGFSTGATMLAPGGILVAILPSSAKGKDVLPGMSLTWSRVYENQFRGASVDVVIMKAERTS